MNDFALRSLWRLTALLVATLLVVGGFVVLAHAFDAIGPIRWTGGDQLEFGLDLTTLSMRMRWLWGLGGAVACLFGLFFFSLAIAKTEQARDRSSRVRLSGASRTGLYGSGEVTVGLDSLHALIVHTAERDPSVREARCKLTMSKAGWILACHLSVVPDASIPDVAKRVKADVMRTLEHHTGLPVVRADLDVAGFSLDARTRVH